MSSRPAARLRLTPRARYLIDTVAGSTSALGGIVDSLTLGSAAWAHPEVIWMPLAPVEALDRRIEGVLGLDLLSRIDFVLDNRDRSLTLLPAAKAEGRIAGTRTPLRVIGGRYAVTARLPGDTPDAALILDSAAPALVLFDSHPARTLRHHARPLAEQGSLRRHAGTRVAPLLHLRSLTIDRLSLNDLTIVDGRDPAGDRLEDGLLPTRFFDRVYFAGQSSTRASPG